MSETEIGFRAERPTSTPLLEGAWLRNAQRDAFEKFLTLKKDFDQKSQALAENGKRQLDDVEAGSALPIQETRRVMNGARAQEKRLEAEAEGAAVVAEQKRKSVFRKWMESPIFKMGVISAAIHGTLITKGMSMPEEVQQEIPKMVLQPQSVTEMEQVDGQRTEREKRIDHQAVVDYKQSIRERIERGETVSFEEEYFSLERLNGVPESDVREAKQKVADLTNQFATSMGNEIDEEELRGFVGVMYGDDENYDWGQGSVAKYFKTGKRNCVTIAKAEVIVLENVIHRLPAEERARYSLGINKIKQHEMATLTIRNRNGSGFHMYMLEGSVPSLENQTEEAGSKTIPIDDLKRSMVAEKPVEIHAVAGKVEQSPDLVFSTNQPVDDGIRIEGPLRGSGYVIQQAHRQGIEPVEVKQHDWGTMELTTATPEEEAEYERHMKWGTDLGLRDAFDESYRANGFRNHAVGYVSAKEYASNTWFNQQGPVTAEAVKKVNDWSGQEGVKYVYHGSLSDFEDAAVKEIPITKAETVAVLYLPEQNTEKIEQLLDIVEGPKKPMVELQIREHELDTGHIHSRSAAVRDEIRDIVARKNLESIALAFKRFSVFMIESDPVVVYNKNAQLNRLNSRTAYDIANGKVKDVYLSGRTIAPGDLLVLEHGKARIHLALDEYISLLIANPNLLGSDKILPWIRTVTITAQPFDDPENELTRNLPKPVIKELMRLWRESADKPFSSPDEPHAGMDY